MLSKVGQLLKELSSINKIKRPWHLPLVAAFCVGLPAMIGAALEQFPQGMLASLGAMVVLYMPQTRTAHRIVTLSLCCFGFIFCFMVGSLSTVVSWLPPFALSLTLFLVVVMSRYYRLPPPGSFFFVVVTTISIALPFDLPSLPNNIGLLAIGGMTSCIVCFIYSLMTGANALPKTDVQLDERVNAIVLEALFVSCFVGGSYGLALALALNNPYWVPISCAAILQGATFRQIWHRNVHRILGTLVGMLLVSAIFFFQPNAWVLAFLIFVLQFIIELLIVKNYGYAVIFITPLTVIMAEVTNAQISPVLLLESRIFDIVLGSAIGFVGGAIFFKTQWLAALEKKMNERKSLSHLLSRKNH
ncbi:FUSC family protein [Marinomonas balearica]|uniref:Fusaric acid resistance family protein n=1 Tax=Marinomonas balearica TaxID=491947 RepID=A0A4R6MFC1_9GAMM|nr:FUSC family protein [Marinomonas balearica]TDO99450.1 fusaric acid resistance family protein [Marinomonas balearica]